MTASIFGLLSTLESGVGTAVFVAFMGYLICLEFSVEKLEVIAEQNGLTKLFQKLQKELMMMGIISFTVFIINAAQSSSLSGPMYESFEMTHIIVLFMALAFIVQGLFLSHYATTQRRHYLLANRIGCSDLIELYKDMKAEKFTWWWFHHGSKFIPIFTEIRDDIEYKMIEKLFIKQHHLPEEFNFAHYAVELFKVADMYHQITSFLKLLHQITVTFNLI
jgi:hypothetical protein